MPRQQPENTLPKGRRLTLLVALFAWILWCVFAIEELVPPIRRHITMWNWLVAWVVCMLPALVAGAIIVLRSRRS